MSRAVRRQTFYLNFIFITGGRHFSSVERNALRAGVVREAEQWRCSSLWRRVSGNERSRALLHPWPIPTPEDWVQRVNLPHTAAELEALRRSCTRGTPFGSERWQLKTAAQLGLARTLRPRGRPRKKEK